MKKLLLTLALLLTAVSGWADKTMYIPKEWQNRTDTLIYKESDTSNKYTWSKSRSLEGDNVIILWDKGYGSTAPNKLSTSSDYYVDINDLLTKCEAFYKLECESLGFVDVENSNLSKYKVMVLLNHTTEWTCYGGGYDYQVPALWINPSTCKPVGSAVAHEVGHSFHYMCYAEASNQGTTSGVETGFHSNWSGSSGQAIWETTANWQALQSYPEEFFTESGMGNVFAMSHNYAWSHEWHRYAAYPFLYYLCEKYDDIQTVANVWNQKETSVKDFNQVLMDNKGLSATDLYKMYYDYAAKCVTWDFDAIANNSTLSSSRSTYIGNYKYHCIQTATNTYQVAYASCPQSTGFNVVPLNVPTSGTTISVDFTAMANGAALSSVDPKQYLDGETQYASTSVTTYNKSLSDASKRGFRLGFVALLKNGTREYSSEDQVYCTGTAESTATLTYTVPSNVQKLWMVVVPAPTSYIRHDWDEDMSDDDQWPYRFTLTNTTLGSAATVTAESTITEKTFTYNLERYTGLGYQANTIDISSDLTSALSFLGCSSVSDATVYHYYGDTKTADAMASYDGWMKGTGELAYWGSTDCTVCIKFAPANSDLITICTFPDRDTTVGDEFTGTWGLEYNGKTAYFTTNIVLVEKPADPLSDYTIAGTYNYTVSAKPDNTWASTSVTLDSGIATDLGLTDLTDAEFVGQLSSTGLTNSYTANEGYWLDETGLVHAYSGSKFFVETTDKTVLRVGQMPGACTGDETFNTILYFRSGTNMVQINLTYNILPITLSDYTIAATIDLAADDTLRNDFSYYTFTIDSTSVADKLGIALSDAVFMARTSTTKITKSYTANNGYFFDANGYACAYGNDAKLFVETDAASKKAFKVGEYPNSLAEGNTYTTVVYLCNETDSKLVQLNISIRIPYSASLSNLTKLVQDAIDGKATLDDIDTLLQKLLEK